MTRVATPPLPVTAGTDDSHLLRAGTRLDEFEILRPLGVGGFGIVYLALDHSLLRQVALKEFMPAELAMRGPDGTVRPRSESRTAQFERGLESFFNEARLLAPFNHPALVRVYRFWKANGTAYMAMQYCPGVTLKQARSAMRAPPDEAWLRAFVEPILGALERLHRAGVFHRDISPDNILLLPNGRPILLDFGSARRVVGRDASSLTAVLKPNFAPIEQYGDEPSMAQGPWTDLYALGATVQFMLTGKAPTPAVMRAVQDRRPSLATAGPSAYPGVGPGFLAAIDWTAAVAPGDRPQSVAALRRALADDARRTTTVAPGPRSATKARVVALSSLAVVAAVAIGAWTLGSTSRPAAAAASTSPGAAVPIEKTVAAIRAAPAPAPAPSPSAPQAMTAAAPKADSASPASLRSGSTKRSPAAPTQAPPTSPRSESPTPASHRADDLCAGDRFIARAICVRRQCELPGSRMHPECIEARRIEEQRQRRMER